MSVAETEAAPSQVVAAAGSKAAAICGAEPGAEWDGFVRARANSTFCHLAGWHDVMAETLGTRSHCLEARDPDGTLIGVLPLVRVKSLLLGDHLVSMPFLNYGGALGEESVRSRLAEAALDVARELGVSTLELRSREREASTLRPTDRKVAVVLPLPSSADALWEGLASKLRSQVRRPMKEGMTVLRGAEHLDAFYEVFAANMRDLGTPVLPRRFFEAAARRFPDQVEVVAVQHGGATVAAGLGFLHAGELEITWASSRRSSNRLSPNMLLYWEMMRQAIERGAARFNFGRSTPGGGTHRFKLQWGGADAPLGWSTWSRNGSNALPDPDRPAFRLATRVWQKLPLWSANSIGPVVARWLP